MDTLHIHLFKSSFGPFISLLNKHAIAYSMREQRAGVPMASSSGVVEVLTSPAMWGALAIVIRTFIKSQHDRKVIITTKDNDIIHAEGLTAAELESVLERSRSFAAIETGKIPNNPDSEKVEVIGRNLPNG